MKSRTIVLKITNAEPALEPPAVMTGRAEKTTSGNFEKLTFTGEVLYTGDSEKVKVGFTSNEI